MSPPGYQPPVMEAKSVRGKKIRQGENWVVRKGNYLSLNFLNTGGMGQQDSTTSYKLVNVSVSDRGSIDRLRVEAGVVGQLKLANILEKNKRVLSD